jgi:hypothetical protein
MAMRGRIAGSGACIWNDEYGGGKHSAHCIDIWLHAYCTGSMAVVPPCRLAQSWCVQWTSCFRHDLGQ